MSWPPAHARRGFLRLYILMTISWAAVFGYLAYRSNYQVSRWQGEADTWLARVNRIKIDPAAAQVDKTLMMAVGESAESMFNGAIEERDKYRQRRVYALTALPLVPLGLPLFWLAFVWAAAGFQKTRYNIAAETGGV